MDAMGANGLTCDAPIWLVGEGLNPRVSMKLGEPEARVHVLTVKRPSPSALRVSTRGPLVALWNFLSSETSLWRAAVPMTNIFRPMHDRDVSWEYQVSYRGSHRGC